MHHRLTPSLLLTAGLLAAAGCGSTRPDEPQSEPMATPITAQLDQSATTAGPAAPHVQPEGSKSRVEAYVNGDVVSHRDVLLLSEPQTAAIDDPEEKAKKEQQALYEILIERLVDKAAIEAGVEVTRDDVERFRDRNVQKIERNGGKLEAYLAERGMTQREFDEKMRRQIRDERWMIAAVGAGMVQGVRVRARTDPYVKPSDVRTWYDRHPESFAQPMVARVRMVAVKADLKAEDREAARAAALALANRTLARLNAGEDWVPIYRELTKDSPEPEPEDGLREFTERGKAAEWIDAVAFDMPRGKNVLHVPDGPTNTFYILRAEGVTPKRTIPYEEASARIEVQLRKARLDVAYYEVCLSLLEDATIKPVEVAVKLREYLSSSRRKLLDDAGL